MLGVMSPVHELFVQGFGSDSKSLVTIATRYQLTGVAEKTAEFHLKPAKSSVSRKINWRQTLLT